MTSIARLADDNATNAWNNAGLGEFDPEEAEQMDADGDGLITESEIETYSSSTATSASAATYTSSDTDLGNTPYSVVDIKDSPKDFDDMVSTLDQCIMSFDLMTSYVNGLVQQCSNIESDASKLTYEIQEISADDGTGSGTNSAYSLTFADENSNTTTDTTDATGATDTTGATGTTGTTGTTNSAAEQINEKAGEATRLTNEASSTSSGLDQVSSALKTTDKSVSVIMNKIGDTKKDDFWKRLGNALFDPGKPFRGVNIFNNFFNNKKDKEIEKVKEKGKEAEQHSTTTHNALTNTSNNVKSASSTMGSLRTTLSQKMAEIDKTDKAKAESEENQATEITSDTTNDTENKSEQKTGVKKKS